MTNEELGAFLAAEVKLGIAEARRAILADLQAGLDARIVPGAKGEPGPAGPRGEQGLHGKDGRDGIAGRDGIGKHEIAEAVAVALDTKVAELKAHANVTIAETFAGLPVVTYKGVWKPDEQYQPGHVVTFTGGGWHCDAPTKARPGTNDDWTLMTKKGRDGRDADRDAMLADLKAYIDAAIAKAIGGRQP